MKSQVFLTAWDYFKSNIFETFSEALKAAWQAAKLYARLRTGPVRITFVKKSTGQETTRSATLCRDYYDYTCKGTISEPVIGIIKFWSLTDGGFRSLAVENLISFR